jgi:hypothetical protein
VKLDIANERRQSFGDWELSIRSNLYAPFGIFLTTPRRRLWIFLRRFM